MLRDLESDDGEIRLRVCFREDKTHRSLLGVHYFIYRFGEAPLLSKAWGIIAQYHEQNKSGPMSPLFPNARKHLERMGKLVGATPHGLRIGLATEAWANGVPLQEIQFHGRWNSPAALLYVLHPVDKELDLTRAIGGAGLSLDKDKLVRQCEPATMRGSWYGCNFT